VQQRDLLELPARTASHEPTFTLLREAEVVGLLTEDGTQTGAVTGVQYLDRAHGTEHELAADVTVAWAGRDSTVRRVAGMRPRIFGVPMEVEWFRLPRRPATDPAGLVGRLSSGEMAVLIDRGNYWQCAYLVRKGGDGAQRAQPIDELRRRLTVLLPWLADRTASLTSWDDVKLLVVSLTRLHRWYRDGLLPTGDAEHAMSPVGGVGINLAIQDAVVAARPVLVQAAGADRAGRS
jgi:2-polyprenyl-6-methoxyphenol hydroxylase-like FAD-dependent oxidoreductase